VSHADLARPISKGIWRLTALITNYLTARYGLVPPPKCCDAPVGANNRITFDFQTWKADIPPIFGKPPLIGPTHMKLIPLFWAGFDVAGSAPFKAAGGAGHIKTSGAGGR
jgi:hypothetical protein